MPSGPAVSGKELQYETQTRKPRKSKVVAWRQDAASPPQATASTRRTSAARRRPRCAVPVRNAGVHRSRAGSRGAARDGNDRMTGEPRGTVYTTGEARRV